jgi:flagellar protein FlgJ
MTEDGTPVYLVLGKDGSAKKVEFPDGFEPTPGVQKIDVGNGTVLYNSKTGEFGEFIAKDSVTPAADAAKGKIAGETQAEAAAAMPFKRLAFDELSSRVDKIINDKTLEELQGKWNQFKPDWLLSQDAVNVKTKIDQLGGDAFLQAREQLKGGGQITDYEGQKAEQALARMSRAQDADELRAALRDFKSAMKAGMDLLAAQANGSAEQPAMPDDPDAELFKLYGVSR